MTTSSDLVANGLSSMILSLDGIGCYLLITDDRMIIGNASRSFSTVPTLSLLANLSSRHVDLVRTIGGHVVEPGGECDVDGQPITTPVVLPDDCRLRLGDDVELRFRRPSPLSLSAALSFESSHRPESHLDGVLWFDEHCLIGAGSGCHIQSPKIEDSIVMFRRGHELRMKLGQSPDSVPVQTGKPVEIGSLRLYAEQAA